MIGRLTRATVDFLKMAWERQPVLVVATVMGFAGPLLVAVSPLTEASQQDRRSMPRVYKVPENLREEYRLRFSNKDQREQE
jgi:hypothetical protein